MNRYRVRWKVPAYYSLEIEADSPEQAEALIDKASGFLGGSPDPYDWGDLEFLQTELIFSEPVRSHSPRRRRRYK